MSFYRLYYIKPCGRISGAPALVETDNDHLAMDMAARHSSVFYAIEVWRGGFKVGCVDAHPVGALKEQ